MRPPAFARGLAHAFVIVCALDGAPGEAQPAPAPGSTCQDCHAQQREPRLRAPVEQLAGSIHGAKQIGCADCHGGRPSEPTVLAHDVKAGFRARVAAGASPEVCGDCHAKIEHGASADGGVPSDPLSLYQGSVHGKARAAGNARAASCASCHGAHAIMPVHAPGSPVGPARVADVCARCHGDAALAASVGLPSDQYDQWRRSVHGQAFERSGAASGAVHAGQRAPTCNDCHDDHAVRERDFAVSGCRGCHAGEWKAFGQGPHKQAFERMGFVACVDCHGSHEVSPADASLIGTGAEASCRRCHAEGQAQFATIAELGREVRDAQAAAKQARDGLRLPVAKAAAVLRGLDAAEASLADAVHALDPEQIRTAAQGLVSRAKAVPPSEPESQIWLGVDRGQLAIGVVLAVLGVAVLFLAFAGGRRGRP